MSCIENNIYSLLVTAGLIQVMNRIGEPYSFFAYIPDKDILMVENKEKVITPDEIYEKLNLSLDKNNLNDYHREILDNYEEKEVDIDGSFNSNRVKLEIIEEPKKLILKPKNII